MACSETVKETARAKLSEHLLRRGLKQTRQREAITNVFLAQEGHVTSEELHERLRREHPEIGAATVYRTLKLLCDAGVANAIDFREGVTLYERRVAHHDHLICVGCDEVIEFECALIEREQLRIAARHGYRMTRHRHELFGLCSACQARDADGS